VRELTGDSGAPLLPDRVNSKPKEKPSPDEECKPLETGEGMGGQPLLIELVIRSDLALSLRSNAVEFCKQF